ncbi:MAG: protein-ADP-ribose hydrolase [Clostridia bacterium]
MKEILVQELLTYFLKEEKAYTSIKVPTNYEEKRQLLRGLINRRPPKKIDASILEKESHLLQLELQEKCITDANFFKEKLVLWQGDITTLKCDAIVNAGNAYLLGCFVPNHTCIDNAIHTYAGISLRLACQEIMQGTTLPNGEVKFTKGYNLPCQYVFHTVGPQISDNRYVSNEEQQELRNCYLHCLSLSKQLSVRTIAFPCISTGLYGYPKMEAAKLAIKTVKQYLLQNDKVFDHIIFNVFSKEDKVIYESLL